MHFNMSILTPKEALNLLLLAGKDYDKQLEEFANLAPDTLGKIVMTNISAGIVGAKLEKTLLSAWNLVKIAKDEHDRRREDHSTGSSA
jgi:hypothetical protein